MCRKCGISITVFFINSTVISLPSTKLVQTYTGKRGRRISFSLWQTNFYPEHRLAHSRVRKVSEKRIFQVEKNKKIKALLCTGPDLTLGISPSRETPEQKRCQLEWCGGKSCICSVRAAEPRQPVSIKALGKEKAPHTPPLPCLPPAPGTCAPPSCSEPWSPQPSGSWSPSWMASA